MNLIERVQGKICRILDKRYLKTVLKVQVRGGVKRCGNDYGGFDVVPEIFDEYKNGRIPVVYSFGIGEDLSFSEAIHKNWNCEIFAFDPTPKSIEYVEKSEIYKSNRFHFYKWGISDKDEMGLFHLPKNEKYVSGSILNHSGLKKETIDVELKRVSTIMKLLGHKEIALLKMDIEGAEFSVVSDILESDIPFWELCIEIHNRFFQNGNALLEEMLHKLNHKGYYIASISENFQEITFIKKQFKEKIQASYL